MEINKIASTCILFGLSFKVIQDTQKVLIKHNDKIYPIKSLNGLKSLVNHFKLKPLVNPKFNKFMPSGKYEGWSVFVIYRKDKKYFNYLLNDPTYRQNNEWLIDLLKELNKVYAKI